MTEFACSTSVGVDQFQALLGTKIKLSGTLTNVSLRARGYRRTEKSVSPGS
jgi:hypothetical protein